MTEDQKLAELAQLQKVLEEHQRKPTYFSGLRLVAKDRFNKFQAYRDAGFSASEALELVIRRAD